MTFIFMVKFFDGKKLAEKIKDQIVADIIKLNGQSTLPVRRPNLAIVLIGERDDSKLYINLKEKEAKIVGIDIHLYKCSQTVSQKEVLEMINCLNKDDLIDGILVQLPLPAILDTDSIIATIDPAKDVDGFHPENLKKLMSSCQSKALMPPVYSVILEILKNINCNLENKQVCLIANSEIFGKSLAHVLTCRGAKVEVTNTKEKILNNKTKQADILITAVGKPKFIKRNMVKQGAVVIDIGITKEGEKVYGDVNFEDVKDKVGFITPVPGGVGPMTIAMAFKNILELYKKRRKIIN